MRSRSLLRPVTLRALIAFGILSFFEAKWLRALRGVTVVDGLIS